MSINESVILRKIGIGAKRFILSTLATIIAEAIARAIRRRGL